MPIEKDFTVELSLDGILLSQGRAAEKPDIRDACVRAHEELGGLLRPAVVYGYFPVGGVEEGRLLLDGTIMDTGPHTMELLEGASMVMAGVSTIGPALEARVAELNDAGDIIAGYVLDCAGVIALSGVGDRLRRIVEDEAAGRGWGVGDNLAPGSLVGWHMRDQRKLCSLLDMESVGVRLSDSNVLVPHKSASSLIGLGPGYRSKKIGSVCRFCNLRDTCPSRKYRLETEKLKTT